MRNEHILSDAFLQNAEEQAESGTLHPLVLQGNDLERFRGTITDW